MTDKLCPNCHHPLSEHDEMGECHAVDPQAGEPCWGICS